VFLATQKLYQLSREQDDAEHRPWCLTVSLSHPHDPYVARKQYWDLYENCQALDPETGFIARDDQDAHSQRLYHASDYPSFDITREQVRRSRRGYFANISYVDDKLGELLDVLKRTRMLDDTTILFCSDHGDMLGERGLWFKMSFFEGSVRVPLMIAGNGVPSGLIEAPVSNLDVTPTLCDLAGIDIGAIAPWTDGQSLLPLAKGGQRTTPVLIEYAAEGSYAPLVAIRDGKYKFVHCELDPPQLFDLEADPLERDNLANDPAHTALVTAFTRAVRARWDMVAFDAAVRESQARRWVVYPALRNGAYYPWDFQPLQKASERYMRNHMNLDNLEESKRYPRGE
jgi:choline-sulfatase